MKKFIPYEKLSKKEQRKINNAKRNDWGELNPVSRVVKSKKTTYKRNERTCKERYVNYGY